LAYALLVYGVALLGPGVEERFVSIASYQHLERFEATYFGQLFLPALLENPMGSGLGIATTPARHFLGPGEFQLMESYFGILAVETGFPGLGTFILVVVVMVAVLLRLWRYVKGSSVAVLWQGLALYVLFTIMSLPVGTMIDSAPGNLYFWFSFGVLVRLAELERQKTLAGQTAGRMQPTRAASRLTRRPWM